jgi:plasmid stabilization system protein ParE
MPRVSWTAPAVADLSNIRQWLQRETSSAFALDVLKRIRVCADRLSSFPALGPLVTGDMHKLNVRGTPYRIFYRVSSGAVGVVRIRHSRENWRS